MIHVIKNGKVFSPGKLGEKDILFVNNKIVEIGDSIHLTGVETDVIDARGKYVCPGFIDQHVHITGGGGQAGFASFVSEVNVGELVSVGTTTVMGMLGTDGFVKELSTLYAKAKALDMEGITAFMLTSFYGLPEKTITGSVAEDLIYIDKVIGCKLALSDDRCSFPSESELLRLINQVKLGGFTSGKHGIIHIHLGGLESKIDTILSIARTYPTLIPYLSPTHVIRTEPLFTACMEFARMGGMIDISTGGTKFMEPHKTVGMALENGVPLGNMTFSSDGRGGVKRIDPVSGVMTYRPAPLDLNYREMTRLVHSGILPLEDALRLITVNPAGNMKIKGKGRIAPGYDADFVFLDESLKITDVYANGKAMMCDNELKIINPYE